MQKNSIFSGQTLYKNAIINLIGLVLPLFVAIFCIPLIIKGIGDEKFGVLSLSWLVIGYFGLFDFGMGRALTKLTAERISQPNEEEIPGLFWTSFFLITACSLLIAVLVYSFTEFLVINYFKISVDLRVQTIQSFHLLAFAIPFVSTTASLRGFLEAYQAFTIINIIRVLTGIFAYVLPLIIIYFTTNLMVMISFLVFIRFLLWGWHFVACIKLRTELIKNFVFNKAFISPILTFSGWMSLANIFFPLATYFDRFLIGALMSAAAITYYSTPMELISRALLIPSALFQVLFPAFSASYKNFSDQFQSLYSQATRITIIALVPVCFLVYTFSDLILQLWLGQQFSMQATLVLKLLSIGIFFNAITHVPFYIIQSIGKPKFLALLSIIELPVLILLLHFVIPIYGLNGVALLFTIRTGSELTIQFWYVQKFVKFPRDHYQKIIALAMLCILSVLPGSFNLSISARIIASAIYLITFFSLTWKFFILLNEKEQIVNKFFSLYQKK
ncbi:MAG: flippase [Ignavibacteria bacterium]|nr:flippase [Ignavibacteria bacterium]